jgi:hypothetical protein
MSIVLKDVPGLLAEVDRLRKENLNLREMIEAGGDRYKRAEAEIERLTQREHMLNALEAYGVDNWEGYEAAMNDEEGVFDE